MNVGCVLYLAMQTIISLVKLFQVTPLGTLVKNLLVGGPSWRHDISPLGNRQGLWPTGSLLKLGGFCPDHLHDITCNESMCGKTRFTYSLSSSSLQPCHRFVG